MTKKKLATVWLGGCSGCHMSLLDIDERILEVAALADIVKSPLVDAKDFDEADVVLVEGALVLEEHVEELRRLRARTKVLVALGDCAVTGNVPSMRNAFTKDAALARAYKEAESNDRELVPDKVISPPLPKVRPLHEAVKVDVFIPGCPPPADVIYQVLSDVLRGKMPSLEPGKVKHG